MAKTTNKSSGLKAIPMSMPAGDSKVTISTQKISNGYLVKKETYNPKAKNDCWKETVTYSKTMPVIKTNVKIK